MLNNIIGPTPHIGDTIQVDNIPCTVLLAELEYLDEHNELSDMLYIITAQQCSNPSNEYICSWDEDTQMYTRF